MIHVEIEREWRRSLPGRLFNYATAGVAATGLPVWSLVVLLRPGGRPPDRVGVHRIPGLDGDAFVFRYSVVPLWQLDARSMLAELGLEASPFCIAMRGVDRAFVQTVVQRVVDDRTMAAPARRTTIRLLSVITAAIFGSGPARRIFQMDSIIRDRNVQELIRGWKADGIAEGKAEGKAEGIAEGKAKGIAEGKAKGIVEGHLSEARTALRTVLAGRSFRLTPELRARIADETRLVQIQSWLKAAIKATSIDEVFTPVRRRARRRPAPRPQPSQTRSRGSRSRSRSRSGRRRG